MYVRNLLLENFKKFEHQLFQFHPEFTAIIGNNASGKTQILDALSVILSTYQSKIQQTGSAIRDIRNDEVRVLSSCSPVHEVRFTAQFPVQVSSDINYQEAEYSIRRTKASIKGRTTYGGNSPFFTLLKKQNKQLLNQEAITLPLLAYYGTGRAQHLRRHYSQATRQYSRFDGYTGSLDPNTDLKEIMVWFKQNEWITWQAQEETLSKTLSQAALRRLIPNCVSAQFSVELGEILLGYTDNSMVPFTQLSDGFRCMISMVMDMVRRIVLLNPHLGEDALLETPGVVLIDELDLYLHPLWQRTVTDSLRIAFPKIQFVVTTHSPFIIQSLESGEVIDLSDCTGESPKGLIPGVAYPVKPDSRLFCKK